jgi:hypothetical protein
MSQEALLTLLLSIPLSILAALLTPIIQDWLATIYFPIRRRRIEAILKEYQEIAAMHRRLSLFWGSLFRKISVEVGCVFGLVLWLSIMVFIFQSSPTPPIDLKEKIFYSVLIWTPFIIGFIFVFTYLQIISYVNRISDFDAYRKEVYRRVEKLGGKIDILEENQIAYNVDTKHRK